MSIVDGILLVVHAGLLVANFWLYWRLWESRGEAVIEAQRLEQETLRLERERRDHDRVRLEMRKAEWALTALLQRMKIVIREDHML